MIIDDIQNGQDTDGKAWFRYKEMGNKYYYLPTSKNSTREAYDKAKVEGIGRAIQSGEWNGR